MVGKMEHIFICQGGTVPPTYPTSTNICSNQTTINLPGRDKHRGQLLDQHCRFHKNPTIAYHILDTFFNWDVKKSGLTLLTLLNEVGL